MARWGAGHWSTPWATAAVNVTGCLALGWVIGRWGSVDWVRALVAVGFLGAYTTMSAFALDSVSVVDDGRVAVALGYVVANVAGGLAAFRFGRLVSAHRREDGAETGGGA